MKHSELSTLVTSIKGNINVVTEANRPSDSGPSGRKAGTFILNSTSNSFEMYDGSNWIGKKLTTSTSTTSTSTSTSTTTS